MTHIYATDADVIAARRMIDSGAMLPESAELLAPFVVRIESDALRLKGPGPDYSAAIRHLIAAVDMVAGGRPDNCRSLLMEARKAVT